MNAHVFRLVLSVLMPILAGARLEKIHALSKNIIQFVFFAKGQKCVLLLQHDKRTPFLFITTQKNSTFASPPNYIMRLRKFVEGRKVCEVRADWLQRKLYLRFAIETQLWLELDLINGANILFAEPNITFEIVFPSLSELEDLSSAWRNFPVLSPLLRKTLACLDEKEQATLLMDLEIGGGDLFVYTDQAGDYELCAWSLPDKLCLNRTKQVFEDILAAIKLVGEKMVLAKLANEAASQASKPYNAELRRLHKLLEKLKTEEIRLKNMAGEQKNALLIQANLYKLDGSQKIDQINLADQTGLDYNLKLEAKLSINENMATMFKKAERGRRGLMMLEDRSKTILADLELAKQKAELAWLGPKADPKLSTQAFDKLGLKETKTFKAVQVFKSSDGFMLLRGRDGKGNLTALKMAKPYDLWLHAYAVAGSHVIVRLNHNGQEVPERTLIEAANLAALKSAYKDSNTAEIECAFVKYVKPIKSKLGLVQIDKHEPSLHIKIEQDLEARLLFNN